MDKLFWKANPGEQIRIQTVDPSLFLPLGAPVATFWDPGLCFGALGLRREMVAPACEQGFRAFLGTDSLTRGNENRGRPAEP